MYCSQWRNHNRPFLKSREARVVPYILIYRAQGNTEVFSVSVSLCAKLEQRTVRELRGYERE